MNDGSYNSDDIALYISQIEASKVLGRSKRRIRLLEHLVRSEFLGHGERLKAYSIGLDIFGKPENFDPASDSVVRVEMGRLRTAISLFEAGDFAAKTRIVVSVPRGTYRPEITIRDGTRPFLMEAEDDAVAPERPPPTTEGDDLPLPNWGRRPLILGAVLACFLAVFALVYGLSSPKEMPVALQVKVQAAGPETLQSETALSLLAQSLSRSATIQVVEDIENTAAATSFIVELRVFEDPDGMHTLVELKDQASTRLIWGKVFSASGSDRQLEQVETRIARELRVRLFGASKAVLEQIPVQDMSPEALFVLSTWVPGPAKSTIEWEEDRIGYARKALEKDPDFGAAHSVLADKLAYLSNVYAPADTKENRQAAQFHAARAMELSPLDADVVFNVAQSHWHSGRISESQAVMARVLELDHSHDLARFLNLVIPYSCAVAPDEILAKAQAFDAELSQDNPIRWLTLTWIGWLHSYREEWDAALAVEEQAARIFQIPYTFMRRAMILNQLGRHEDAKGVVQGQNTSWVGFSHAHYVENTIPRLCQETENPDKFIGFYKELAEAVR